MTCKNCEEYIKMDRADLAGNPSDIEIKTKHFDLELIDKGYRKDSPRSHRHDCPQWFDYQCKHCGKVFSEFEDR